MRHSHLAADEIRQFCCFMFALLVDAINIQSGTKFDGVDQSFHRAPKSKQLFRCWLLAVSHRCLLTGSLAVVSSSISGLFRRLAVENSTRFLGEMAS